MVKDGVIILYEIGLGKVLIGLISCIVKEFLVKVVNDVVLFEVVEV